MGKIKINELSFYYEQCGSGPDLLLISGVTSDHRDWQPIIRPLSENFRVTVFDNRGVGQTDAPNIPYTIEMMADDTAALIQALDLSPVNVVGHSMGGMILEYLLVSHAELVQKAMIVCSRTLLEPAYLCHCSVNGEMAQQGVPKELLIRNNLPFLFGDRFLSEQSKIDDFVRLVLDNPHPQSIIGYQQQLHATAHFKCPEAELSKVTTPVFILSGEQDRIATKRSVKVLSAVLPHAELKELPGVGHMPQYEEPEGFVAEIKHFFLSKGE